MENYPIIEKAWHVYHDGMVKLAAEYYHSVDETPIYYADSRNQAKLKAREVYDWGIDDREPTYIDIKVKRAKEADKVLFRGETISRSRISGIIKTEKRNKKLMELPDDEKYLVQDRRNYVGNSVLWWAKDHKGYTCDFDRVHIFTKDEILKYFIDGRDTDIIWSLTEAKKGLKTHIDAQKLDFSKSI